MWNKLKTALKSSWAWLIAFAGLVLISLRLKGKYESAIADQKLTGLLVEDAKEEIKSKERKEKVKDLKKEKAKAKSKKRTPKQVEEHYNGKKRKL